MEAIGGCGPTAATASEADGGGLLDLEDMGSVVKRMGMAGKRRKEEDAAAGTTEAREMVTPELKRQRRAAMKEEMGKAYTDMKLGQGAYAAGETL